MTAGDKNPILISFRWSSVRSMATPEKVVALQGLKNKFKRERCFGSINFGNKPGFEPTDLAATHHLNIGRLFGSKRKKNFASYSSSCKKFEPSQRQWQLTWVTQMWRMWRIKKRICLKKICVKYSPQIGQNYFLVEQKSFVKQWFWWSPGLHEIVESRWFDSRLLRGVSAMSRFLLSKPYFKQA